MAKAKNYNNYAEVAGNVSKIYQQPNEKNGEMRFNIAVNHKFTRKDGTEGSKTNFLNVLVRPGRRYAKQDVVTKGAFLRVIGHLEDNSYKAEDGTYKGGMEINADKITLLVKREDGKVQNTETGEVEENDENTEIAEA